MRKRKIGNALLAFTAAAMVLAVKVGSTDAYFTTFVEAQGGAVINLGGETTFDEKVKGLVKNLTVENKIGSEPVYVRAKAFCGSQYELKYEGADWLQASDGFWLYKKIVEGGEDEKKRVTTPLTIKVTDKTNKKTNSFDVTVIYESIPIQYDEAGDMLSPVVTKEGKEIPNPAVDWNNKLDVIESKPAEEDGGKD